MEEKLKNLFDYCTGYEKSAATVDLIRPIVRKFISSYDISELDNDDEISFFGVVLNTINHEDIDFRFCDKVVFKRVGESEIQADFHETRLSEPVTINISI